MLCQIRTPSTRSYISWKSSRSVIARPFNYMKEVVRGGRHPGQIMVPQFLTHCQRVTALIMVFCQIKLQSCCCPFDPNSSGYQTTNITYRIEQVVIQTLDCCCCSVFSCNLFSARAEALTVCRTKENEIPYMMLFTCFFICQNAF